MSATPDPALDGLDIPALERFLAQHVPGFSGRLSARLLPGGRSNLTFVLTSDAGTVVLPGPAASTTSHAFIAQLSR